jgi:hypothetical protein
MIPLATKKKKKKKNSLLQRFTKLYKKDLQVRSPPLKEK